MKAAAEGKKKEAARRSVTHTTLTMSQSMIGTVASSMINSSPSSQSPRWISPDFILFLVLVFTFFLGYQFC